ncbi:MAG: hypothetical protein AB3N28_14065 [Kordiimonas sp.]
MFLFDLETYTGRLRLIGAIALIISIIAWITDLTGMVYECPYCRTQRTVIGLLGIILMLPNPRHWIPRYIGSVFGFLGAYVAANQHFRGWARVSAGEFQFNERIYIDPTILSGCALFIIIGLVWLLLLSKEPVVKEATA